jgi:hypothetical protein
MSPSAFSVCFRLLRKAKMNKTNKIDENRIANKENIDLLLALTA